MDRWIARIVFLEHNLNIDVGATDVGTRDVRDFGQINGLSFEDWR
jgi:hypothetical protein